MLQHKNKIITATVILIILSITWFWGGNYAKRGEEQIEHSAKTTTLSPTPEPTINREQTISTTDQPESTPGVTPETVAETTPEATPTQKATTPTPIPTVTAKPSPTPMPTPTPTPLPSPSPSPTATIPIVATATPQQQEINSETGKDKYQTDPVPQGKPLPVEPQNMQITDTANTCTLSVRCDTILANIHALDKEKLELVPDDGIIFPATSVTFYEGESVFNLLQREMKRAKIHMSFRNTPIYNSAYIQAINNLYEFDCGELSGWMYKVNGWFPNYGSSRYQLKPGDVIEWVYTCDLGNDVGGGYAAGGSQAQ